MSKFKYKIGLEVHVQLKTMCKLFSRAYNDDLAPMNSKVAYFDVAVPGTFPSINVRAIWQAIMIARIFNCEVDNTLSFDRKHYYYMDLPSGFQITQYYHPVGKNGVYKSSSGKLIGIKQVHIECDAGKTSNYYNKVACDYNRCGVPLVEIVSNADFESYDEIEDFIRILVSDLHFNDISNALFEMGNIRIDVNISRIIDDTTTTVRYEIKNLNSLRSIKKVVPLAYEKLVAPTENTDTTFAYDVANNKLVYLRPKEQSSDYMYMYETGLYPLDISELVSKVKCVPIISSVEEKNRVAHLLPGVHEKFVMNIITNKLLYRIFNLIVNNFDKSKYIKLSAFASEVVNELSVSLLSTDDIYSLMLDAFSILVDGSALKVNVKITVCAFLNSNSYCKGDLVKRIIDNNMLLVTDDNTDQDLSKKIADILNSSDSSLLNRAKTDKKAMNFAVGLVIKKLNNLTPSEIIKSINSLTLEQC